MTEWSNKDDERLLLLVYRYFRGFFRFILLVRSLGSRYRVCYPPSVYTLVEKMRALAQS